MTDSQDEDRMAREYVQSLERGLAVIQAFGPTRPEMTLSEVAAATGLTRAAARRFLYTLSKLGHVSGDGKRFRLTAQVLSLGYAYLSSLPWWQRAQPHMEAVVRSLGESCSVAVLDGFDIVYVARIPASRILTINPGIGTRFPAFVTSLGRVLLADQPPEWLNRYFAEAEFRPRTDRTETDPARLRALLAEVRRDGFALMDQELEMGLRSLSVPLRDRTGRVIAAMNVSASAAQIGLEDMRARYLPVLREAADAIGHSL